MDEVNLNTGIASDGLCFPFSMAAVLDTNRLKKTKRFGKLCRASPVYLRVTLLRAPWVLCGICHFNTDTSDRRMPLFIQILA